MNFVWGVKKTGIFWSKTLFLALFSGSKFSHLLTARAEGPETPITVSLTTRYLLFFDSFLKPETVKSHFHCTSKISTSFFCRRTDVPCSVLYLQMNAYLAESLTKQLSIAQLFGQPFWNEFVGAKKFPTSALLSPSLRRMRMVGFGGAIEDISQDCTTAAT